MEEKLIGSSALLLISVPVGEPVDTGHGLIEIPPDSVIRVGVVLDFINERPNYTEKKDWWNVDLNNGIIHVKFPESDRKRFVQLMDKQLEMTGLSKDEENELETLQILLSTLPKAAAENAIRESEEIYQILLDKQDSYQNNKEKKSYRTIKKAGEVAEIPTQLATITNPSYQNSTSLYKKGNAYLQPLVSTDNLKYDGNTLYFKGFPATVATLKDSFTNQVPQNLDLSFLQLCFSIILANFNVTMMEDNTVNQVISIYYPKLAQALGKEHNISRSDVKAFIGKIASYQTIMGIIDKEIQPVLLYVGEDTEKNIVYMSSPYLVKVARTLFKVSIRKNKKGEPMLKKDGSPKMLPAYSYLINSSITKERNKKAVENVRIIVAIIEQAGNNIPHIKAKTIIERNPQLKESLEGQTTTNQNSMLKRTFKKTWELLKNQTKLTDVYQNIELPDPKNPANIPTTSTLDMVFNFPHNGKNKMS